MLLIATDEAGYGPKLGPLVVAATAWRLPENSGQASDLGASFNSLATPTVCDGLKVVVNDSKAVFKPRSSESGSNVGYRKLELATLAGADWCGVADGELTLGRLLDASSLNHIRRAPWLHGLVEQRLPCEPANPLGKHWSNGDASLLGIRSRMITATEFNGFCSTGRNKSDLLSETTLRLVRDLLTTFAADASESVRVFCDRHGGRRYYAGPIQAAFDGTLVQVLDESKGHSAYRVPIQDGSFDIAFTVKGDSFTPVAYSSMVAKYLREKAMERFNAYFQLHHATEQPLRPTAGYPVDADRFLEDVRETIERERIKRSDLVRAS